MKRDIELEATLVAKYAVVAPVLDERSRRRWAAAESLAIGYGGDAVVSSATGVARETIRKGRREIARDEAPTDRIRRPGGGRPRIQQDQPGIQAALQALVDPLTRGDPTSPLRWTCKSRAKLAAALTEQGWRVSSTTVGRLLHRLGYRLQSPRKRQEGATHPDGNRAPGPGRTRRRGVTHGCYGDPRKRWTHSRWSAMSFTGNGITNCYPDQVEDFISITALKGLSNVRISRYYSNDKA